MAPTADDRLDLPAVGERQSLREQVAHALRAALITGEMRPGMVYSAPVLAAQFGVSATPVREAMLDLAKEGLVEAVRNKGFRVTELSERDLDELTEIRRLIEVPTVAQLADPARASSFEELRPLAQQIVDAAEHGDLLAYVDADIRFHLELLSLGGNAHLVEVVRDLRNRARLYGLSALHRSGGLTDSAREHLTLLTLLSAGDSGGAERLMREHIRHVRGIWASKPED
ncbi:DNA-binding GntR family transcriptional regulator [Streptosporangium becharense]|uniref:DNA-binding GntR family transcriptional regulator n=1 Tax=Streptosporangium becharense TaxID=1816182 RepID=A0A7W9ICE5_9ACTN|nr:GntR family transcriptional regulator [Streptosporangium becharense]MBB2915231.1 DNA-binding GntR family transcriptional regulator [Streptosporangium becharense]MBB5817940.1 DNA-binding GntR family transcriptional regulator [Streptosporangium becharense]